MTLQDEIAQIIRESMLTTIGSNVTAARIVEFLQTTIPPSKYAYCSVGNGSILVSARVNMDSPAVFEAIAQVHTIYRHQISNQVEVYDPKTKQWVKTKPPTNIYTVGVTMGDK
jgi:Kelch motif protein